MAERNYFIPSLIIFIIFLVLCIIIFLRDRKIKIFLLLIPAGIVVLYYSPIIKRNSTIDVVFIITLFLLGSIINAYNYKKK